jgi:hypothetical protein
MENLSELQIRTTNALDEAIDLMESFDPSPAMTIGYDKTEYHLTGEQMAKIHGALYLASCELHDLLNSKK